MAAEASGSAFLANQGSPPSTAACPPLGVVADQAGDECS
jgi:hypothetical protein